MSEQNIQNMYNNLQKLLFNIKDYENWLVNQELELEKIIQNLSRDHPQRILIIHEQQIYRDCLIALKKRFQI